jgi:hypothetical protein
MNNHFLYCPAHEVAKRLRVLSRMPHRSLRIRLTEGTANKLCSFWNSEQKTKATHTDRHENLMPDLQRDKWRW